MKTMGLLRPGWLLAAVLLAGGNQALAQTTTPLFSQCRPAPAPRHLVGGIVSGLRHLPSRQSAGILALGGVAALGVHPADTDASDHFAREPRHAAFEAGTVLGNTPFELGAAIATYAIGRARGNSCTATLGADLIQAQLLAEIMTVSVKQATRRNRPDGTGGFSFPSGHTTVAFASATVLERHYGWKVGVPAYAVASYVAASRVRLDRHYLSDVAFGAALGIVVGRSVTLGRRQRLVLTPIAAPDGTGAGLGFTWIGR